MRDGDCASWTATWSAGGCLGGAGCLRILITENAQTLELIVGYMLWRSATLFGSDGNSLAGRRQRVDLEGSN